jgi:hypothetical protein
MYKLFHQLDRDQKELEEKENAELFQLEALYNNTCRRDSFSTITTHETELIVQGRNSMSQPVTRGGGDGRLPLEISIETQGQLVVDDLNTRDIPEPGRLLEEGDEAIPGTLPTSLFVDDDEELNLIFKDEYESDVKELHMSAPPLISHSSSGSSDFRPEPDRLLEEGDEVIPTFLFVDDDEELSLIFKDENESDVKELDMTASPLMSQSSSGSSDLPIEEDPEEILRFETEQFTRFEI